MSILVRLQAEIFDPGGETNQFITQSDNAGAAVTFTGLVRSTKDRPIESLTLEHYPALAQKQLTGFAEQAVNRFDLLGLTVIHRFGELLPNEPIVQVMALAEHRQAAFDGANFVMDFLKTDAPFWKQERIAGTNKWVAAKGEDDTARDRWKD